MAAERSLEEAATDFSWLIEYAAMHGAGDERVRVAFRQYAPDSILQAWVTKIAQEKTFSGREPWCELLAETKGANAAGWVRSLWQPQEGEKLVSGSQRAYLTAACLPCRKQKGCRSFLRSWTKRPGVEADHVGQEGNGE